MYSMAKAVLRTSLMADVLTVGESKLNAGGLLMHIHPMPRAVERRLSPIENRYALVGD